MSLDARLSKASAALGHLAAAPDGRAYLRSLADVCAAAVAADRCTLYLVDHRRAELRGSITQGDPFEIVLPIGRGLAGHCASSGETINVENAYDDPRFDPTVDGRTGYRTKTTLVVPMWGVIDPARVIGVIQVLNKRDGTFEWSDQLLLERVAAAVGASVERIARRRGTS